MFANPLLSCCNGNDVSDFVYLIKCRKATDINYVVLCFAQRCCTCVLCKVANFVGGADLDIKIAVASMLEKLL